MKLKTLPLQHCLILLSFFAVASFAQLHAQALDTAVRPSEFALTGGYINGTPDYGPDRMQGVSFGGMFTRYYHFPIAPSTEGRVNIASTNYVKQTTYLGGLRLQGEIFKRFHPYGDFLLGGGDINFKFNTNGYTKDNSLVYNYGGGIGIDVIHNVQLTVDFQRQRWNLGTHHSGPQAVFDPTLATIGVKYTIPFHSYVGSSGHNKHRDDLH